MIISYPTKIVLTKEQQEELYWNEWVFNSHRWEEYSPGYFKCDFCERIHTSVMPIGGSLCPNNPRLKKHDLNESNT